MEPYEVAIKLGDSAGVRLEMVGGVPVWEAFPTMLHQITVDNIRATIRPAVYGDTACQCVHLADVYIRFPDGSLKRPDISIFCQRPAELKTAITLLPEAVIEIISEGYEAKDLEIGIPFYQRMGIKDIVVFDPDTNKVKHFRPDQADVEQDSPVALTLTCGCTVTV